MCIADSRGKFEETACRLLVAHTSPTSPVKMSAVRPTRSCRVKVEPPVFAEVMARINSLTCKYYEQIRKEFNAVSKYYHDDGEEIAGFWLTDYEYDLDDFKHQFLIRCLLSTTGLKEPFVVEFLDSITDQETLTKLGVVRISNVTKTFYRIRTGLHAD